MQLGRMAADRSSDRPFKACGRFRMIRRPDVGSLPIFSSRLAAGSGWSGVPHCGRATERVLPSLRYLGGGGPRPDPREWGRLQGVTAVLYQAIHRA